MVAQRSRSSRPEGSGIRKHAIPRDRAHGVPRDDRPVAVIDIGSNSGRVIVYRREAGRHLHVLAGSRASLRLAISTELVLPSANANSVGARK